MGRVALFLIFVGVPILEIALFVQIGGVIGLWPTLGIVVLTALAGTALMRAQGIHALDRLRGALEAGGNPAGPIAHGALILVAGVLLLTPGFFTDGFGLALLVPALRTRLIRWGASQVTVRAMGGMVRPRPTHAGRDTIEADYEVVEPETRQNDAHKTDARLADAPHGGRSGWTARR